MKKLFNSASILAVATLSLSAVAPVSAAITGCTGGSMGQALWSDISGGTFTCTIDDKVYSDFTFSAVKRNPLSGVFSGIEPNDQFSFSTIGGGGLIHNINIQSANSYQNVTLSLGYKVTRANGTNVFRRFSSNMTGDIDTAWALKVTASNSVSPGYSQTTDYPNLGQTAATPNVVFVADTITSSFMNTLQADENGAGVTQFANRLDQMAGTPPTAVPGPLPLIGAAAAFGFSRKLRNRIKLAA
jgi:hypothetical protein